MSMVEILLAAFSTLTSGFCAVLWHTFKRLEDMTERTKDDLMAFKLDAAKEYATNKEVESAVDKLTSSNAEVFRMLESIRKDITAMAGMFRDKLDTKQDKESK